MRMLVMMSKKSKVAKVARMTFVEFRRIFGRRKMMMQTKLPQRPIWKTMTSSELFLKSTKPCHHHKYLSPPKSYTRDPSEVKIFILRDIQIIEETIIVII